MRRISITGIVVAHVASLTSGLVVIIGLILVLFGSAFALGMSLPEFSQSLDALGRSSNFLLLAYGLAFACTVLGGYIAGRYGGDARHLNALAYCSVGVVLSAVVSPWRADDLPSWYADPSNALAIAFALLGGFLAKWPARRASAGAAPSETTVAAWPGEQPEPGASPSLPPPGPLEDGHLQERSRLRRSVATLLWFFPLSYYVNTLLGGLAGAMAGSSATSVAEAATVGREASVAFFDQYGLVVLACQAGVTLALSLRGTLPGTSRYRCTRV